VLEKQLPDLLRHNGDEERFLLAFASTRTVIETAASANNLCYVKKRIEWMLATAGMIDDARDVARLH